jgi:hypothetical protein
MGDNEAWCESEYPSEMNDSTFTNYGKITLVIRAGDEVVRDECYPAAHG